MKLIRKIAMPVTPYPVSVNQADEINNLDMLTTVDSQPAYFEQIIKPLLAPGQDAQLVSWLRNVGLLPQTRTCKNSSKNVCCNNSSMQLIPTSTADFYQWICPNCLEKKKIREDTIFHNIKCKFNDAVRLFWEWSQGNDHEMMADVLNIKKAVAKSVYNVASNSARDFIRRNISEFRLGGPGIVVLVDTFPDIHSNIGSQEYNSRSRLILCIAEVKEYPTRFYFQCLERYSKTATDQITKNNAHALQIVRNMVLPGSVLVGNANTTICSYDTLKLFSNKGIYPIIVSTQDLLKHDNPLQSLVVNLEVIWNPALRVVEEAQYCRHSEVAVFLAHYLFCQRFGKQTFEMLLRQLSF